MATGRKIILLLLTVRKSLLSSLLWFHRPFVNVTGILD